jgi:hypothetical protein
MTLRNLAREAAASLAAEAGIAIEHVAKSHVRKEAIVTSSGYSNGFAAGTLASLAKVLEERGEHPGLVHLISAMEATPTSHGTTSKRARPICARTAASVCTIISTSWTSSWA